MVNRKMELVKNNGIANTRSSTGNAMVGISYLFPEQVDVVWEKIKELCSNPDFDDSFWEEVLYKKDKMIVLAKVIHLRDVIEINTY